MEEFGSTIEKTLGSFDSLSVALVSTAKLQNETWPFITLPDYAIRASKILPFSKAVQIAVYPIVKPEQRIQWEQFSLHNNQWVEEAITIQETWEHYYGQKNLSWIEPTSIMGDWGELPYNLTRLYTPTWLQFPVVSSDSYPYVYNWDYLNVVDPERIYRCIENHKTVLSGAYMIPDPGDPSEYEQDSYWADWYSQFLPPDEEAMEPVSDVYYPIINELDKVNVAGADDYNPSEHEMVGYVCAYIYWRSYFRGILPNGSDGIVVVVDSPCNLPFTFQINGPDVVYLGVGDHHDKSYDHMVVESKLQDINSHASGNSDYTGAPIDKEYCPFTLTLYPSDIMKDNFTSSSPIIYAVVAVLIFVFTSVVFIIYDCTVEKRQRKVMSTALRTNAIVSSLFPSAVRDRLYPNEEEADRKGKGDTFKSDNAKRRLQSFLGDGPANINKEGATSTLSGAPIAELYPETTVFFADIAGFTAWSSVRQPSQVFVLLETIYGAFDKIARKRGIFKVETIGDSYVAVCGLPTPRKNHAVVIARFGLDCREKMMKLLVDLETTLGPGTADLKLRIGLNSGPTTAGVLRGEKGRFQLFGDTVNTASRMESTGVPSRIQVSQKTADLLIEAGKEHWLSVREEKIHAKGKGEMQTYWCEPKTGPLSTGSSKAGGLMVDDYDNEEYDIAAELEIKRIRLVNWHAETFEGLLRKLVASRGKNKVSLSESSTALSSTSTTPRSQVSEYVPLRRQTSNVDFKSVELPVEVMTQLRDYLGMISRYYHDTAFHNFEHASHVTMSTEKLLDRIATQEKERLEAGNAVGDTATYGITSDELAKFAMMFSALIHDVDHKGVPNATLIQENTREAITYEGKSVAEQNSVDVAWNLLMKPDYNDLRQCMFETDDDMERFHKLVSNIVVSTDLFDQELKKLRETRWQKTFNNVEHPDIPIAMHDEDSYRKATVILELIIQASDVSHTMQHFTVYKKWNQRLLEEMYVAYKTGRSGKKNPLEGWYEGEMGFFDFYIIPLAKKLRECGVFGVSCDEFLDFAKDNRVEWEMKGRDIVREAREVLERKYENFEEKSTMFEV